MLRAAAAAVVIIVLKEMKTVVLPFVFALFLFYLTDPVVNRLAAWRLPRWSAILVVLLAMAGLLGGALTLVGRAGAAVAEDAPRYRQRLEAALGEERTRKAERLLGESQGAAAKAAAGAAAVGAEVLLVFAYVTFLLIESPRARQRWKRAFPRQADRVVEVLDMVEERMVRFVWYQTLVSLGTALVFGVILAAHGVKLAAFWSLLNFVSQFVPNIGPIVTSVPPVLMTLLDSEPRKALSVGGWLLASQFLIGNFLEPKIIGHGMKLDPISVLVGIVFFGWLWGVGGALMAVPMLVAIKTVCESVPSLRPAAGLLQGTEKGRS